MRSASPNTSGGMPLALGAYLLWGLFPLYFLLLKDVPSLELVGWRVVFTIPVCIVLILLRRQVAAVVTALRSPRILATMALSALLIGINWVVYVIAIQSGHVFAASLGYYINPLVNVLFGTIFLSERLSRRQWLAVAIAATGIALLASGAREMLWISLTLAVSFGGYGLVRKLVPVESLPGLTIESTLLVVPAIGLLLHQGATPAGISLGGGVGRDALIAAAGVITAVPLLMFAAAARRMDYSVLGFVQFLTPTMVFLIGLATSTEPLKPVQLTCFVLIWTAVAIFCFDLLSRRSKAKALALERACEA